MKKIYPIIATLLLIVWHSAAQAQQQDTAVAQSSKIYSHTRAPILYFDPQQPHSIDHYRELLRPYFPIGYEIKGMPLSTDPILRKKQLENNENLLRMYGR